MFKLKKQMKRILYCAMAAALFVGTVGCADEKEGTDDPTVDNAVDPDLYDVDPQPETDQEEVKMNTTLYFFSDADAARRPVPRFRNRSRSFRGRPARETAYPAGKCNIERSA